MSTQFRSTIENFSVTFAKIDDDKLTFTLKLATICFGIQFENFVKVRRLNLDQKSHSDPGPLYRIGYGIEYTYDRNW